MVVKWAPLQLPREILSTTPLCGYGTIPCSLAANLHKCTLLESELMIRVIIRHANRKVRHIGVGKGVGTAVLATTVAQ
eukprot:1259393-Amphidinium_carterae.2